MEIVSYIIEQITQHRQDIADIEESCVKAEGYSFEDSMNIEFYEGMIAAYSNIMKIMEIQEIKDDRTSEAKAFEAGWFAQLENLEIYLPESRNNLSSEWHDQQYDLMIEAYNKYYDDRTTTSN